MFHPSSFYLLPGLSGSLRWNHFSRRQIHNYKDFASNRSLKSSHENKTFNVCIADRQIELFCSAGLSGGDAIGRLVRGKHHSGPLPTLAKEVSNRRRLGRDLHSEVGR